MISIVQAHPRREQWGKGESAFYWGDSAQKLEDTLRTHSGKVQLAYMDPPFMTGGNYRFIQRVGEAGWQGNPRYQVTRTPAPITTNTGVVSRNICPFCGLWWSAAGGF